MSEQLAFDFGEPRRCVHEPVDNSPATMARRREWMRSHGE